MKRCSYCSGSWPSSPLLRYCCAGCRLQRRPPGTGTWGHPLQGICTKYDCRRLWMALGWCACCKEWKGLAPGCDTCLSENVRLTWQNNVESVLGYYVMGDWILPFSWSITVDFTVSTIYVLCFTARRQQTEKKKSKACTRCYARNALSLKPVCSAESLTQG